jgi:hypothetical protein
MELLLKFGKKLKQGIDLKEKQYSFIEWNMVWKNKINFQLGMGGFWI